MRRILSLLVLYACTSIAGTAQAALIDRGGGLIYDTTLNITWLRDANYAKTSGYDTDGKMSWYEATAWAEQLIYGKIEDWRLPNTFNQTRHVIHSLMGDLIMVCNPTAITVPAVNWDTCLLILEGYQIL